jgi:hypothetical protein
MAATDQAPNRTTTDPRIDLVLTLPWGTRVCVDEAVVRAVVIAVVEAARWERDAVGSVELLHALVADGDPRLMSALTDVGIDARELRERVVNGLRGSMDHVR